MALGIACAGTGSKEAIALVEPMTNDPVNYVRQGALIASSLILIQHTEQTCPKVKDFRAMYAKVISEKHEDVMAKFGAILAQGIIDAGGRNVTVSLQSRTGHTNMMAVVGMLVFTQYWYWFPLSHFLALAFTPSCVIALNADLDMPVVQYRSNAKPSMYAYPAPLEEKKKEDKEKVATAVLSITAKQKKKEAEKHKKDGGATAAAGSSKEEKMEVEEEKKDKKKDETDKKKDSTADDKTDTKKSDKEEKETKEGKDKKEPEPTFEILNNPARVMKPQLQVLKMEPPSSNDKAMYTPIKDISIGGIVMVKKVRAAEGDEKEEIVEPVKIKKTSVDTEDEPEPPEPFEYTE